MSSRSGSGSFHLREAAAPLALLAALGLALAATLFSWIAASVAAAAGFTVPPLGSPMLRALLEATIAGALDPLIGPNGSRPLFWLVTLALTAPVAAAALAVAWRAAGREARFGTAAGSLAGHREYRDMHGKGAQLKAVQLRPSLAEAPHVAERDLGLRLGRLGTQDFSLGRRGGHDIYASEEDVVLEIAGPRSNKTSALVVPAVLSAPGPVITTSNKVDVYSLTVGMRSQMGRVFVLDPQGIAGAEQNPGIQRWWWNALAGIRDMADAQYLVGHFSRTVGSGHERADPYFTRGAERLLGQLMVAAAVSGPRYSLRNVRRWLATQSEEPVGLLHGSGMPDMAEGLQGTIEAPNDQRGGLYETALTAISCLESEAVARYVTPPSTWNEPPESPELVEELDPWRFVVGYRKDPRGIPIPTDTLYLLTREGAGTGAPVVAALVDNLLRITAQAATARGGRVDPPVRAVLDEAANICPIANLPDLYSYFGSMSIQVVTILQSYKQGVAIWNPAGMDKLWSAATVKLIGAGVHDPEFCENVSRLIGDHDVPTWSDQRGRGSSSSTRSTRPDRILSAADVAALPKTSAVLISSGRRPTLLRLLPWYSERDADTISEYAAEASAEVRQAAITALGPDNPLAQLLAQQAGARP
jgi:type IV secretion system protein VirD4